MSRPVAEAYERTLRKVERLEAVNADLLAALKEAVSVMELWWREWNGPNKDWPPNVEPDTEGDRAIWAFLRSDHGTAAIAKATESSP